MTPPVVAEARGLASHRPPVDAARRRVGGPEHVREVDDAPAASPRRPRGPGGSSGGVERPRRPWRGHSRTAHVPAGRVSFPRIVRQGARQVVTEGPVIIIGGAEDKVRDRVILSRFATLAGGRDATVVGHLDRVVARASRPASATSRSSASSASPRSGPIHAMTRAQANDETAALAIRDATGIFLTGGNQLRLSSTIGGTRLADAVLDQFRQGAVVAGTSAGASAMSSHMIAFGASGATPKHRMAQIAAGLGVLPGVIVDQHFQQRNRLGRLLSLIAQNPCLLGLGVDEDTAGVVGPDHVMEVIGRGSITVVDGARSETDAWEVNGHRPLMISGVVLHSLPAGYRFDLRRRERSSTPDAARPAGRRGRVELDAPSPYTDGQSRARRPSVTETAEPTTSARTATAVQARHRPGPPATAAADAAHPRDARPARPELLGARAGHPPARRPRRPRGLPLRTRSRASPTRSSRCCRRSRTTPARSAGAAASSPGCGKAPGSATSPSTSRSSSRTSPAPTSATARPARPARTASTTSSTSTARRRSASRPAGWPSRSSTTSSPRTTPRSSSTSRRSSSGSSGWPSGRPSGRRRRRSSTRRSAATSRSSASTATRSSSSATASTSSASARR